MGRRNSLLSKTWRFHGPWVDGFSHVIKVYPNLAQHETTSVFFVEGDISDIQTKHFFSFGGAA